jgi:hypothetical protein
MLELGIQTVELRHRNIHDDHCGAEFVRHVYSLLAIGRFTDHLNIALGIQ